MIQINKSSVTINGQERIITVVAGGPQGEKGDDGDSILSTEEMIHVGGADLGYLPTAPDVDKVLQNYWIPRLPDPSGIVNRDEQDEFAFAHMWTGSSISSSPSPSSGSLNNIFLDDSTAAYWTTPYPLTLIIDVSGVPVPHRSNANFQVGFTFRSYDGATNPTHIKIEQWDVGLGAYQATPTYDQDVTVHANQYWLSPKFLAIEGSSWQIYKLRITFTGTNSGGTFGLQRVLLYHDTATRDPWHLHIGGGSVYGDIFLKAGLRVGTGATDPGDGNIYATGDVSAATFTDRTPAFQGDALDAIQKIATTDHGEIDHDTLPELARATHRDRNGKLRPGRDLGAMISVLTTAVQQLIEQNEALVARIEKLEEV